MWIIFLVLEQKAIVYGIHPRDVSSLKGIFFAPFIHASRQHILSNTLPILILSWILAIFYERFWLFAWFLMSISAGALLWIIGRASTLDLPTYHVGASITIFALIGFFLASGIFRKQFKALLVAIVIGFLYGGALYGILPSNPHVSWEGHLSGFIAGIFWAYVFRNVAETRKAKDKEELIEELKEEEKL